MPKNSLHIIHLDDHQLFRAGVKQCLLSEFPNCQVDHFSDPEHALEYLEQCLQDHKEVDCIITDYNHAGDNGLEFTEKVRMVEKQYSVSNVLLLLTMSWQEELFKLALKSGLLNGYLSKAAECENIITFIKNNIAIAG